MYKFYHNDTTGGLYTDSEEDTLFVYISIPRRKEGKRLNGIGWGAFTL